MKPLAPTPYQHAVLTIPEHWNVLLAGGRGGGKSVAILLLILRHVEKYGALARPLVIRETDKALEELETEMDQLLTLAYPRGVRHNRADHVFRLPSGAVVELGHLQGPDAYKRYQGRSFTLLVVDEYGLFKDQRRVALLKSNLRAPAEVPLREVRAANPGGSLHAFIHQNFVSKAPAWHPFVVDGETWVVAPSTLHDNPHLDHEDYTRRLRAACGNDEELLRAWLTGDWNIARGAMFAGVLDQAVHMLPVAWPHPVTKAWRPFIAHDYGASAPSVTFVCLRAPGGIGPFAKDSLVLLDELATCRHDDLNAGLNWPPSKICEAITEMCGRWGVRNISGVGDDYRGLDASLLQIFQRNGIYLQRPVKGRVATWAAMRERLHNATAKNGRPGLYISARCKYFWQTVPFIERDEHRPEDVNTDGPDHALDAAGYAVRYSNARVGSGSTTGMY